MKFMLLEPWPVAGMVIPAGAEIEGLEPPEWNGLSLPRQLPLCAKALDLDGGRALIEMHRPELHHHLHFAEGIRGALWPPRNEIDKLLNR